MRVILEHEARPLSTSCTLCSSASNPPQEALIRCTDCFAFPSFCKVCALSHHPFHHLQCWSGTHYTPTTLKDLGFTLNFGHNGAPCPGYATMQAIFNPESSQEDLAVEDTQDSEHHLLLGPDVHNSSNHTGDMRETSHMTIINQAGIFEHNVRWCICANHDEHHVQLLRHGLFPSTTRDPRTAFTFSCLDAYHIDIVECKTSASSHFAKLRRLTNEAFPHIVKVCLLIPNCLGTLIMAIGPIP